MLPYFRLDHGRGLGPDLGACGHGALGHHLALLSRLHHGPVLHHLALLPVHALLPLLGTHLLGLAVFLGSVLLGPAEGFLFHPLLPLLGRLFRRSFRGLLVPEEQTQAQNGQDHQSQELVERRAGAAIPVFFPESFHQELLDFLQHIVHPFSYTEIKSLSLLYPSPDKITIGRDESSVI